MLNSMRTAIELNTATAGAHAQTFQVNQRLPWRKSRTLSEIPTREHLGVFGIGEDIGCSQPTSEAACEVIMAVRDHGFAR